MSAASSSARILINQLKKMQKEPVEGFTVELIDESDVYKWRYYIKGPTDTPYENGIYQGTIDFPEDYPFSPPTLTFTSEFWHPNVYTGMCRMILNHLIINMDVFHHLFFIITTDGKVCIRFV